MSKLKKCGVAVVVVLLVIIAFFQAVSISAIVSRPHALPTALKENGWLIPLWITAILLTVTAMVLAILRRRKEKGVWITVTAGLLGAALSLVVALTLRAALPLQVAASNISRTGLQGLDGWKLFCRHYSLAAVGAVTAVVAFIRGKRLKDERIRKENEGYKEAFDFSDYNPLFSDEPTQHKKLSKKQRQAQNLK